MKKTVAGKNTLKLQFKIARKRLLPGSYRATLVTRDAAGNVSNTVKVSFKVLKRKKSRPRR